MIALLHSAAKRAISRVISVCVPLRRVLCCVLLLLVLRVCAHVFYGQSARRTRSLAAAAAAVAAALAHTYMEFNFSALRSSRAACRLSLALSAAVPEYSCRRV